MAADIFKEQLAPVGNTRSNKRIGAKVGSSMGWLVHWVTVKIPWSEFNSNSEATLSTLSKPSLAVAALL
jgi:hypothetical protein